MASLYTPPSIITTRQDLQASVVLSGGTVVPCLIGTTNGNDTLISAYTAAEGATDNYTFSGLGANGPVKSIRQIRSKSSGGIVYQENVDFTFNAGTQVVDWSPNFPLLGATSLASPYILSAVESTGGTLSGTYYYVVTAMKLLNVTGLVFGETVASNEFTFTTTAASKKALVSWMTVTGAEQYRVYRTTVQGDYTGSHLIATVLGEFSSSYLDDGTAPGVGSPPGVPVYAQATATNLPPYNLEPSQTMIASVVTNGGAPVVSTATFTATRATRPGSGAVYAAVVTGTNDTVLLSIDSGPTQTITFTNGTSTQAAFISQLNAQMVGGFAVANGGQIDISSDSRGSGSKVYIYASNGIANIGHTTVSSPTIGTGNVANIDAVTAAEILAIWAAVPLVGATASTNGAGYPVITHNTAGVTSTLTITGTASSTIGYPGGTIAGNTATAGTALRRPALNGGAFFVDYIVNKKTLLTPKVFSDLKGVISEHGLGSNLTVGATVTMAGSGRGQSAPSIMTIAIADNTLASFQAALDILETRRDLDIVVPCFSFASSASQALLNSAVKAHCNDMSTQTRERRGIVGAVAGTPIGDASTAGSAVWFINGLADKRMQFAYPNTVISVQGTNGLFTDVTEDGWITACMLAGQHAALPDRATPATAKQVFGITSLGAQLSPGDMDILGALGGTIIEEESGIFVNRDSLTTDVSNDVDRHPSILLVEDLLRGNLRTSFRVYRGQKLVPTVLNSIAGKTEKVLASLQKLILINGYDAGTISVTQDPTALTNVIVTFSYKPIFPLRTITFLYSFDLTPTALAA